jgi:hypothetical protein
VYSKVRDDGLSPSEVAEELELTAHSVRVHLRRAERAIRAELVALDLMPEGTEAPRRMLLDVPAVRRRRAHAKRRTERGRANLRAAH